MSRGHPDLLTGLRWECAAVAPGELSGPDELARVERWRPMPVPGTVAAAIRAAGDDVTGSGGALDGIATGFIGAIDAIDGSDWWLRARLSDDVPPGPALARFEGLATIADVWLGGEHLLHSENMFRCHHVELARLEPGAELVLRFSALRAALKPRRPRGRWRASIVNDQGLRWFRTTLLGRMPGIADQPPPVGPWRPVRLHAGAGPVVLDSSVRAAVREPADGPQGATGSQGGTVRVDVRLWWPDAPNAATVTVAGVEAYAVLTRAGQVAELSVEIELPDVRLWWPHTHGEQPLYRVVLRHGDLDLTLGSVGFRTVVAETSDDGFALRINGVEIFSRGVCWMPLDVWSLQADESALRVALEQVRAAGMNMVRLTGYTVYESDLFYDLCDELGILVWQDCMLAAFDPPDDEAFVADLGAEVGQLCDRLSARPCLVVVCGGEELEQQPAMLGIPQADRRIGVIDELIPAIVADRLPGVAYLPSSPTGGPLPFRVGSGVAHYFGVGAYLRPLSDVRQAGVRFAAECLAFAIPPERSSVDLLFGSARPAGHDPVWKCGVARDAQASWDFDDVRDHYVAEIFGLDPTRLRFSDAERYLDLGRAAVAEAMRTVFTHWRRPNSVCGGGLVLSGRDLAPGAGWGLVDVLGVPKAPWYVLRRVLAPVAVLITDDGLDGLSAHVVNDGPHELVAELRLTAYGSGGQITDTAVEPLRVAPHTGCTVTLDTLMGYFRDLNHAYEFGPPAYEAVAVELVGSDGQVLAGEVHLSLGQPRPVEADLGLSAAACPVDGGWLVTVATRRLAQWVAIEARGCRPDDSWFHLPAGGQRQVLLRTAPAGPGQGQPTPSRLRGTVRAINQRDEVVITVEDGSHPFDVGARRNRAGQRAMSRITSSSSMRSRPRRPTKP